MVLAFSKVGPFNPPERKDIPDFQIHMYIIEEYSSTTTTPSKFENQDSIEIDKTTCWSTHCLRVDIFYILRGMMISINFHISRVVATTDRLKCSLLHADAPSQHHNLPIWCSQSIPVSLAQFYTEQQNSVRESVALGCCFDAASLCSVAKWKAEKLCHCGVLQSWGPETFGPEVFWTRLPEACHCRRAPGWSDAIPPSCGAPRGRSPDSRCATSKDGSNTTSFCHVVLWRWQDHYLGRSSCWRLQFRSPRSA